MPSGRGVPVSTLSGAPSGLSGPGRGVGIPNMMPSMGRGMTPIPQNITRLPSPGIHQMFQGMMQPNMVRAPMMNQMMIRPPLSNLF